MMLWSIANKRRNAIKRLLVSVLLSAALIVLIDTPATQINNSDGRAKVQAVQAEIPRKESTLPSEQEKALTEQQTVSEPETVVATPEPVKVQEPAPQITEASGCEKYRNIMAQYSWNVNVAIAVCNAESSGNANTSNMSDYHAFADCWGSYGLFQINCARGIIHDPVENIRIAASMYEASGWQPWSATTCRYKVNCY